MHIIESIAVRQLFVKLAGTETCHSRRNSERKEKDIAREILFSTKFYQLLPRELAKKRLKHLASLCKIVKYQF